MSLISDKNINIFNLTAINRGDCVRFRRAGDRVFRNGFVTKINEYRMEILFCNVQNNSTSFANIDAADVAVGIWEIYWTTDFMTINYQPGADVGGGSDV